MNEKRLDGEVALVTGASRGIGRAIAVALGRAGAAVALAARDEVALNAVCAQIAQEGGRALAIPADLENDADVQALIPIALEKLGKLTILINNAGYGVYGPIEQATPEQWDRMMQVNARAPLILCQRAIAPMRQAGGGAIVNIASVVGVKGYKGQGLYGATKHALMGFSKVLAQEVQPDGIRVHTICPGGVDTDLVRNARPDLDPSILIQSEEIAEAVLFLLTYRGRAAIDNLDIRRANGSPWA